MLCTPSKDEATKLAKNKEALLAKQKHLYIDCLEAFKKKPSNKELPKRLSATSITKY
jgi:hypothetical protein